MAYETKEEFKNRTVDTGGNIVFFSEERVSFPYISPRGYTIKKDVHYLKGMFGTREVSSGYIVTVITPDYSSNYHFKDKAAAQAFIERDRATHKARVEGTNNRLNSFLT